MFSLRTLVAVALVGLGAQSTARAEIIDRILVQVEDEVITQTDVLRFLPIYVQVYGLPASALTGVQECASTVEDFVGFLVEATILHADADARELGVSESEVEDYISQQHGRLGMSRSQFVDEIESTGILFADFEEFMELNLDRMRMLQLDVGARVQVSDDDVDQAIEQLYPEGLEEVFVSTHHIFVQVPGEGEAEARAREAILAREARLDAGESFESVAADNDDGTARTGGRLGRISVLDLDGEYARAALELEPGEVSGPVRSSFGYHLIRLDAVDRAPVDDAQAIRDRVLFDLHNERVEEEQDLYLERVRNEAFVHHLVDDYAWYCGEGR